MKTLTEHLICELSSATYKSAAEKAKAKGDPRAEKFFDEYKRAFVREYSEKTLSECAKKDKPIFEKLKRAFTRVSFDEFTFDFTKKVKDGAKMDFSIYIIETKNGEILLPRGSGLSFILNTKKRIKKDTVDNFFYKLSNGEELRSGQDDIDLMVSFFYEDDNSNDPSYEGTFIYSEHSDDFDFDKCNMLFRRENELNKKHCTLGGLPDDLQKEINKILDIVVGKDHKRL